MPIVRLARARTATKILRTFMTPPETRGDPTIVRDLRAEVLHETETAVRPFFFGWSFGEVEPPHERAVSRIAAERLEPRIHSDVDDRRLAVGARLLETREHRIAIAHSGIRQREVVAGNVGA